MGGVNGYYSYHVITSDHGPALEYAENDGFPKRYGYDLLVIFSVITILTVLATIMFAYWCCIYPKTQRKRFDFEVGHLEKRIHETNGGMHGMNDSEANLDDIEENDVSSADDDPERSEAVEFLSS